MRRTLSPNYHCWHRRFNDGCFGGGCPPYLIHLNRVRIAQLLFRLTGHNPFPLAVSQRNRDRWEEFPTFGTHWAGTLAHVRREDRCAVSCTHRTIIVGALHQSSTCLTFWAIPFFPCRIWLPAVCAFQFSEVGASTSLSAADDEDAGHDKDQYNAPDCDADPCPEGKGAGICVSV